MNQIFDGVYREGRNIATKNKFKGNTVYGEKIISEKGNGMNFSFFGKERKHSEKKEKTNNGKIYKLYLKG